MRFRLFVTVSSIVKFPNSASIPRFLWMSCCRRWDKFQFIRAYCIMYAHLFCHVILSAYCLAHVIYLQISKHKPHQDKPAAMEIWDKLDEYMRAMRSSSTF
jgi:hypothetical protein